MKTERSLHYEHSRSGVSVTAVSQDGQPHEVAYISPLRKVYLLQKSVLTPAQLKELWDYSMYESPMDESCRPYFKVDAKPPAPVLGLTSGFYDVPTIAGQALARYGLRKQLPRMYEQLYREELNPFVFPNQIQYPYYLYAVSATDKSTLFAAIRTKQDADKDGYYDGYEAEIQNEGNRTTHILRVMGVTSPESGAALLQELRDARYDARFLYVLSRFVTLLPAGQQQDFTQQDESTGPVMLL